MDKKLLDRVVWILLGGMIVTGMFVFLVRVHPLTIYDTDDWTYIISQRRGNSLLPNVEEWNPIKVLPENLMPLASQLGNTVLRGVTGNFYDSLTIFISIVFVIFVASYLILLIRLCNKLFELNFIERVIISVVAVFIHFIPFLRGTTNYEHFFYGWSTVTVYNYTIPALLNAIVVLITLVHEDHLRHFFRNKHWLCKTLFLAMIYFAIFSNLYSSIILAVFAACKVIQYIFIEARDYTTDTFDKLIQCVVYFYTLILWIISLIFEVKGGRAQSMSDVPFDLGGAFKAYLNAIVHKNPIFVIIMSLSIATFIVLLVYVCRNRNKYIKPILDKLRETSKKKREENSNDKKDILVVYTCYGSFNMLCMIMVSAFVILLCAKTGSAYMSYPSVQFDFYFYIILSVIMLLSYSIKKYRKSKYGAIILAAIMVILPITAEGKYAEYNNSRISPDNCRDLAQYIIDQYIDADINGIEHAYIHVPDYHSGDNFPIANYGNGRIPYSLHHYGVISHPVDSEFVIDEGINGRFGLPQASE